MVLASRAVSHDFDTSRASGLKRAQACRPSGVRRNTSRCEATIAGGAAKDFLVDLDVPGRLPQPFTCDRFRRRFASLRVGNRRNVLLGSIRSPYPQVATVGTAEECARQGGWSDLE